MNCSGVRFKILMAVSAGIRVSFRWKPTFGKTGLKPSLVLMVRSCIQEGQPGEPRGDRHKGVWSVVVRADNHEAGRKEKMMTRRWPLLLFLIALSGCSVPEPAVDRRNKAIALYNTSVPLINAGQYKKALPILRECVATDPANMVATGLLGRVLIECGHPEEGRPLLEKVGSSSLSDPAVVVELAYGYEKLGEFSRAIEYFQTYNKLEPARRSEIVARIKALKEQQTTLERILRAGGNSETDYFVFATFKDGVARWKTGSPVSVYIDRPHSIRGHQPHFEQLVLNALRAWEQASGGAVKFVQVSDRRRANIRCAFVDNPRVLDSPIKEGETRTTCRLDGLRNADIKILTIDRRTGQPQSDHEIHATALHELGHALGIAGHSPDYRDIMFFSGGGSDEMRSLSNRDVATLRALYSSAKAYMPPKGSKQEKQAEQIRAYNAHIEVYNDAVRAVGKKQYERAIAQANEFLKLEPNSDMARELIESVLNRQALEQIEQGQFDAAEQLLNQALTIKYKKRTRARAVTKNNLRYLEQQRKSAAPQDR